MLPASCFSSLSIAVYRWLKFFYFVFDCKKFGTAPHHPSKKRSASNGLRWTAVKDKIHRGRFCEH